MVYSVPSLEDVLAVIFGNATQWGLRLVPVIKLYPASIGPWDQTVFDGALNPLPFRDDNAPPDLLLKETNRPCY